MIESQDVLVALVFGGTSVALFVGLAGARRMPWRHAALGGVGFGVVLAAFWFALPQADLAMLVLVGALGGCLAQRGFERAEQDRLRTSNDLTAGQSAPQA